MNEIETCKNNNQVALNLPGCQLTPKGAIFEKSLSFEKWQAIGGTLRYIEKSVLFWIGDWINYGEKSYGDKYAQAIDSTGYSYQTLQDAAWVSRSVEISRRRENLSFSHHKEVAGLEPIEQNDMLLHSESENVTSKELRAKVRNFKNAKNISHKVVEGDSWKITDDQTVIKCDAVITDPPYGILDEEWEPKNLSKFTFEWAKKWNDCEAHTFIIFWSQRHLFMGKEIFDECLSSYDFTQILIWHYPNNKKPQSRKLFKQTYEPVFYYRKKGSNKEVGANIGDWSDGLNSFDCHVSATPQTNFLETESKMHPAQKPLSVMRWIVNAATFEGDRIADPFCGSGTTGIASVQLKRSFHGIETNKEYSELAKSRISKYGK